MTAAVNGRVSVIIPAYNSGRYIEDAIKSVLSQTYSNTECIVVDDGSTDNTAAKAKGFGVRVNYIFQKNSERSAARNTGIAAATGEYICFLDADDSFLKTKVSDQVRYLETHPEQDVVYSKVRFFHDDRPDVFLDLSRQTPEGDILAQLLYGNFITMHAPLIRRSTVAAVSGFDTALSHNEDWEFFLRIALAGASFGFLDQYHALCRLHGANTSRDEIRMHEAKWQVAQRFVFQHREALEARGVVAEPVLAFHEADFGKALIANGKAGDGRRHIFNASRRKFPSRGKYLSYALSSYILGAGACSRLGGGAYRSAKGGA